MVDPWSCKAGKWNASAGLKEHEQYVEGFVQRLVEVGLVALRCWWIAHWMYLPRVFRDQIAQKWVGCQLENRLLFKNHPQLCCQSDERLFLILGKNKRKKASFQDLSVHFFNFLPLNAPRHAPPLPAGDSAPSAGCASGHELLQWQRHTTDAR